MKSIFLVNSPLQLLDACEARHYFGVKNAILIIKENANKIHNAQIDRILEIWGWDNIIKLPFIKGVNFIRDIIYLKYLSLKYETFEYFFMGDYYPLTFRLFVINIRAKNIILIDDGTITIDVANKYLKTADYIEHIQHPIGDKLKKLFCRLLLVKTKLKQTINYFTCYNITPHKGQKVYINNYELVNNLTNDEHFEKDNDIVYFIGAPFVEMNMISINDYLKIFKSIININKGKQIIYVSHRFEKDSKLSQMKELDIKIMRFKNIFELEFIFQKKYPLHIYGFHSSALVTTKIIYRNANVVSVMLNEKYLEHSVRENFISFSKNYINENNINSIYIDWFDIDRE